MNILLIIFAVCLVAGLGLMIYHLMHAPVGEETAKGFKVLSPSEAVKEKSEPGVSTKNAA